VDVPWTVDLDPNAVFGSNPSVPVGSTFPFLSDVIGTLTAAEQAAASSDSLATEIQTAIRDQNTDTLPIAGLQLIPAAEQAAYQAALTAQYPVLGAALYQAQSDDLGSSLGAIGGLAGSSGTDAAHRVGSPHDGPRLGAAAAAPAATPAVAPRDGSDPNNPNDVANDATGGITIGNVFQNGGQDLPNPVDLLNPPPPSASEQSTINTLATAAGNTPHSTVVSASDCGAAQANVSQSLAPLIPPGWSMQPVEGIVPPSYYQGMSGSSGITGLVGEYMVFASMEVSNSFGGYYPAHYATMVTAPSGNSYLIDTYLGSVSVAQMAPIIPPSIPLKPTQAWVLSPNSPSGDALDYATALTTTWIPFSPGANSVTITAGACPLPPHANVPQSTGKPPGATTATSTDPNSIGAFPTGAGAANWIPGGQPLSYVIHFENEPTATAPAVNIRVRVPLDANLDPSTLQFPADLNPYGPTTETYAPATRTITFELPNVDLPPDTAPPNGENQVGFTAQPLASTTTGTPIDESAQVFFDYNPPVATGTILRTVNTTAPTVTLTPFTATEAAGPVTVGWQPDSAPGVADYAVDVSTDGGPLQPLESTTSTSIQFPAAAGHRYQFSVTATDVTGLTGPASPPEGFLTAGAVAPPDVTALSQNSGSPQGYQEVVLDGTGFTGATSVAFGASPALQFTVENDTRILAVVPPGAGTVPVVVTTPVGSSPAEGPTYTYIPPTPGTTPPTVGGGGGGPGPTAVGYRLVGADGGVFAFDGAGYFGSEGGHRLAAPVVGIAATPDGGGYWLVGSDGGVFSFGDAAFEGSLPVRGVHVKDVVGMVGTPDGRGYWLVASDGGVFSFGDATFFGSMGGAALARPVVGLAPTTDGRGYWLVGSDGGVFSFGDARFIGSEGGHTLQAPIVGIASAHGSSGYWLVGSDGGVFSFGTARFFGSAGGSALTAPVVGIGATSDGGGYTLAERDGSARSFGDAAAGRSLSGIALNSPVTAIAG
jgi:hypothetical protein